MSGGCFDYKQYHLEYIADAIQSVIDKNGKEKIKDELWHDKEWYERYPEDKFHHKYSDETIEEFKKGVELIRKARIYADRIDWLLSGDNGEETFLKRLRKELNEYNVLK